MVSRNHGHVTLKVYISGVSAQDEFKSYQQINGASISHPGRRHIRTALDIFTLPNPQEAAHTPHIEHHCIVQKPMWESWKDLLQRNPSHRFTLDLLKAGLQHILLGLDFLHRECKLIHTDIKADNILQEIADDEILHSFTREELRDPSPRKLVNGHPVYESRRFDLPRNFGAAVLSDFGAAESGTETHNHDVQPNVYRSPEVMLNADWSYPADIWNFGCMIWDLFEGGHLFCGDDPDGNGYSTCAHLAEVVTLLGPPPPDLLVRGVRSREFFSEDGDHSLGIRHPSE